MSEKIVKRIVIPFDNKKTFANGKPYLDRPADTYVGIMIDGAAVFIDRDKAKELTISDKDLSADLPLWYIEHKGLEIFIDTSDEPTLFS